MRLILAFAATTLVAALAPAVAGAATTPNFAFKHNETNGRTGPTVAGGGERECLSDALCTYEMHEFEIKEGEQNGSFAISVSWAGLPGQEGNDTQQDYDLYVYRVATNPEGDEV